MPKGYSVSFTEDTLALIDADKLRFDGNDWRIYYLYGSMCTELDHWIDTDLGGGLNSHTTRTWFKTKAAINAHDSDGSYFLHYGNAGAGTPPAHWSDSMGADPGNEPSQVFLAADDFEEHVEGQQPDGWGDPMGGPWPLLAVEIAWHVEELRIAGDTVNLFVDDIHIGGGTLQVGAPAQGASGFWCQYGQNAYRDNHIVRLYVDPEPETSTGDEEFLP